MNTVAFIRTLFLPNLLSFICRTCILIDEYQQTRPVETKQWQVLCEGAIFRENCHFPIHLQNSEIVFAFAQGHFGRTPASFLKSLSAVVSTRNVCYSPLSPYSFLYSYVLSMLSSLCVFFLHSWTASALSACSLARSDRSFLYALSKRAPKRMRHAINLPLRSDCCIALSPRHSPYLLCSLTDDYYTKTTLLATVECIN